MKRYDNTEWGLREDPDGDYVLLADIKALLKEIDTATKWVVQMRPKNDPCDWLDSVSYSDKASALRYYEDPRSTNWEYRLISRTIIEEVVK